MSRVLAICQLICSAVCVPAHAFSPSNLVQDWQGIVMVGKAVRRAGNSRHREGATVPSDEPGNSFFATMRGNDAIYLARSVSG